MPLTLESLERERAEAADGGVVSQEDSAIARYEDWCREPTNSGLPPNLDVAVGDGLVVGVESEDTQEFLKQQLKILEVLKAKAPDVAADNSLPSRGDKFKEGGVSDHIGPVQFNMGGIQVDADDILQRIKVSFVLNDEVAGLC